jgi:Short C-terminal domain
MFGSKKKKQERVNNLMTSGGRGVGTLTNVRDTGMTINDNPRVKMTLRVEPLDGSAAFEAEKTSTVSRVRVPQIGNRYPVFYNLSDPSDFMFIEGIADENGRQTILSLFGNAFGASAEGVGMPAVAAAPAAAAAPAGEDHLDKLKKLAELRDAGALTDAEFEAQKAQILASAVS